MDRCNNTRTDKSHDSDHGATSPKSIIQDTDFRIVAEGAVSTPVALQPVGGSHRWACWPGLPG